MRWEWARISWEAGRRQCITLGSSGTFDKGARVFSAVRRTNGSGDLKVMKAIENLHGRDELLSKARDISTGSVCDVAFKV